MHVTLMGTSHTTLKARDHCILRSLTKALRRVPIPMPMPTHAHGFWVGMGAMLLFMGGHEWAWVGIGFVCPCIQLQIIVKLLGCREYANQ
jgi:hypothetical protein